MSLATRTHTWRRQGKKFSLKKLFTKGNVKNALLGILAIGLLGSIATLAALAFVSRDLPDPNSLTERNISQSTKIYDRTGEHLLYEIHGDENRTLVKMQEGFCKDDENFETDLNGIPLFAVQATIAAEDHGFCSHYGFSVKGVLRAALFAGSRGGGSTLTQQLVKNAILSSERTVTRKLKELILSVELERRYSKDEILQIYFNEIPYGSTNYGIESAAQNYFRKTVKELTLGEAASLAALPQRPTSLLNNPDILLERRNWILDNMVELEFVSQEQADAAKNEPITIQEQITNITAPHFVFYVKQLLEEDLGFSQRDVEEGGLNVITTLDLDRQKIAEEEVVAGVEARGESYGFTNASLIAMDPKNGQVLAMVGSKDYFDDEIDGQVNVALRPRQPGSSFKPIVYAAGFEKGYTPDTVLWDVKTEFPTPTGLYAPNNYDLGERGPLTVRKALQGSLNIPAVKMVYLTGVETALSFAERLGYTTFADRSRFGLAIVLGGAEVKLLEHTAAYGVFANEGVVHETVAVLKVEDSDGNVLYEWKENEGKEAVDKNVARTITNVLSDNASRAYIFGPSSYLQLGERPVAAKTGTTNDYHDAWTVGYTPSLAAGVWVGNNDNAAMVRGADGSVIAAPIWNAFMKRALEGQTIEVFTAPELIPTGKSVLDGQLESQTVTIDTASGKRATEYTPASYREERTFAEYHTILQYIDKDDPLGEPPANPTEDPYYEPWERAVADWLLRESERTGITLEQGSPPTEYDDLHVPENFPTVTIESPSQDDEFYSRLLSINVNASAPRGVRRVELYIDGYYLGSDVRPPYELTTTIPNTVGRGYHTLKVLAYDDIDNTGSASVGIRLLSDAESAGFEIIDPKNGQTIERIQNDFTVVMSIQNPADYAYVSVYAEQIGGISRTLVGTVTSPQSPFLTVKWTLPEDGDWVLSAHAEGSTDLDTPGVVVHVVTPETPASEPLTNEGADADDTIPDATAPDLNPFGTP
jgi:membrane peptidoglycan carboxypeptidase